MVNIKVFFTILFVFSHINVFGQNKIVISKKECVLYVIRNDKDTVFSARVAVGKNKGNKRRKGDNCTPEGTFNIIRIHDSTKWTHDFKDGFGNRKGAYGPFFFRLKTPTFTGIGIHGTCFPESIGTRCSEGCVRLTNEKLLELKKYVYIGMKCIIEAD